MGNAGAVPSRLIRAFVELIIPGACAGCGLPGEPLCATCRAALPLLGRPGCLRCGHPGPVEVTACRECPPALGWSRQALAYDAPVARLMEAFKDARRRALANPLAAVMAERIAPPARDVVLVPIPLGRDRLADRGFNQSALLARRLGQYWQRPVLAALSREEGGQRQRGSSRSARAGQVAGVFTARGPAPHHVVLVDDVLTTGATFTAAARVLRAAGCAHVGAVATARVVVARRVSRVG